VQAILDGTVTTTAQEDRWTLRRALAVGEARGVEIGEARGVGIGEARRADSMGLRIMDYRARLIGAFLLVERQKKGGTRVRCLVPASPAPTVDVLGPVAAGTNAGV